MNAAKKQTIAEDLKKIAEHVNDDGTDNKMRARELAIVANSAMMISDSIESLRLTVNRNFLESITMRQEGLAGQTTVVVVNIPLPSPLKRLKKIFSRKHS